MPATTVNGVVDFEDGNGIFAPSGSENRRFVEQVS